jgi:hypothetical protein
MGLYYQDLIEWQKAMDRAEEGNSDSFLGRREVLWRTLKRRSSWRVGCTILQKSRSAVFSDCRQGGQVLNGLIASI